MEIRKFRSKNLVDKCVNIVAPSALKLTYEHLYSHFSGDNTPEPVKQKMGEGKAEREEREKEDRIKKNRGRRVQKKGK